jgi:hypothetical protein
MLASISNSVSFSAALSSEFTWSSGAKPTKGNAYQAGPFAAATSEAPLFSMLPIQGQDFANRLYSPLTSHFTHFMLRDEDPETLLLLMGAYIWVIDGDTSFSRTAGCDESKDYKIFRSPCTYWNDPRNPDEQDKFWYFVDTIEYRKEHEDKVWLVKLSGDLDADTPIEEAPSPPTASELETAAKDGLRWTVERYELVDRSYSVRRRTSQAPTDREIAEAMSRSERWIVERTPYITMAPGRGRPSEVVYELLESRPGRKARVAATTDTAPTAKDILDAAKAGFRWVKKGSSAPGLKYTLVRPAQYSDRIFAILDFDPDDPNEAPLSSSMIRQHVQPDPQNYIYVDFRHTQPQFKAFIKIRDFVELLTFFAASSRSSGSNPFPPSRMCAADRVCNGESRQFVGQAKTLPDNVRIEASISYAELYFFVPSSEQTRDRDREAFRWLYTLYQMSQIDVSKLPLVPVTISK